FETLLRDIQGTAAHKLVLFEKLRAAAGFANERPSDLAATEKMLREFAAMEKGKERFGWDSARSEAGGGERQRKWPSLLMSAMLLELFVELSEHADVLSELV